MRVWLVVVWGFPPRRAYPARCARAPFAARKGKGHPSAPARLGFGFRRNDGGVRVVDLPPAPS